MSDGRAVGQRSLASVVMDEYVRLAVERGDYRQAIAYRLQCTAGHIPADVGERDYAVAATYGVGSRRWWAYYRVSRSRAVLPEADDVAARLDALAAA